mgnify:CR=1 FL=1
MSDQYKGMLKRGKNTKFDFLQISNITLDESWSKCRLVSQKNEALNKAKTAARADRICPFLVYTGLQIAQKNLIEFCQISRILRREKGYPELSLSSFLQKEAKAECQLKNTQKKKKKTKKNIGQ